MTQLRVARFWDGETFTPSEMSGREAGAARVVVGPDGAASGLGGSVLGIGHRRAFDFVVAVVRTRVFHILF